MKKLWLIFIAIAILLVLAGVYIPIDSYISGSCPDGDKIPTQRLDLIKGETLNKYKNAKEPIGAGCSIMTKYELYVL